MIEAGGSTFVFAHGGDRNFLSVVSFNFAKELSVVFGAGCNIFAKASLGFAKELLIIFSGGCNIFTKALLGLAGGPTGVVPSIAGLFVGDGASQIESFVREL